MEVPGRRFAVQGCDEDRPSGVHCEPCEENNREQIATGYCVECNEFICAGCQQTHRGSKISRHHNILDQANMPRHKLSSAEGNFCPKHGGKLLEYYCRTHGEFLCGVCVNLNHRQCVNVDFIKDAADGFVNSKEYEDLVTKTKHLIQKLQDTMLKDESDIDEHTERFAVIISDIKNFREEINTILDTLERNMIAAAECLKEEIIQNIKTAQTKHESTQSEIAAMKSDMENSIKYKQDQQLLITAKKAKSQITCFDNQLNDLTSGPNSDLKLKRFKPNTDLLNLLKSFDSLGTLEDSEEETIQEPLVEHDNNTKVSDIDKQSSLGADSRRQLTPPDHRKQSNLYSKEPKTWKASFQGEIRISIKQDKGKSYITSGVELGDGGIVLADNNNSCLKIIDADKKNVRLLLQLPFKPWDIVLYRQNQYVVTTEGKLVFVNIDQVSSLDREIQIKGDLRGIAYHEDNFIVTCAAPNPCVKIIDMDGRVIRVIQHDKNGRDLFVNPWYLRIIPNQNQMLISDFENHAVIGLNMNGQMTSKYCDRNLKGPTGLAVDPCGVVFLTGRKSHNVHMISGACTQIQLLLHRRDGEELPQCPILCRNQDKMLIGHNWRTRMSNTLSVYDLH